MNGHQWRSIGLLWLAAGMVGCSALPEVGPFVDTTVELRSAVASVGPIVRDELQRMQKHWNTERDYAAEFALDWKQRIDAADALVAYANSLRAIVDSGNAGGESVEKLIGSLTGLAGAANIAIPVAEEAVSTATDIAKFLFDKISLMRAAGALEDALVRSQPAVEAIAAHLFKDLEDADDILLVADSQIRKKLTSSEDTSIKLGFRKTLLDERRRLHQEWQTNIGAKGANIRAPESESSTDQEAREREDKERKARERQIKDQEARLLELDRLLVSTEEWFVPLQQNINAVENRVETSRKLIAAADNGVGAWVDGHRQLTLAVKDRRPISPQSLVAAAVDIRRLIRKVREL